MVRIKYDSDSKRAHALCNLPLSRAVCPWPCSYDLAAELTAPTLPTLLTQPAEGLAAAVAMPLACISGTSGYFRLRILGVYPEQLVPGNAPLRSSCIGRA